VKQFTDIVVRVVKIVMLLGVYVTVGGSGSSSSSSRSSSSRSCAAIKQRRSDSPQSSGCSDTLYAIRYTAAATCFRTLWGGGPLGGPLAAYNSKWLHQDTNFL
jgi:hypothetical protein